MEHGNNTIAGPTRSPLISRAAFLCRSALILLAIIILSGGFNRGKATEVSLEEYQIKALFLLNFAKYVDWPDEAFASTNAPIVIGILGNKNIEDHLVASAKGKVVQGREILTRRMEAGDSFAECHLLFIDGSQSKHLKEILLKSTAQPVLTVGETEHFLDQGGIIKFVRKNEKIRLEINAASAAQSNLQISSKLLCVADRVKGGK